MGGWIGYEATADVLVGRMLQLIRNDPTVMDVDSVFDLFKRGLECDDLEPSLAQAQWSFGRAKHLYKEEVA